MKRVIGAIEKGRCVIAVAGSLLRDAEVMLALKQRAGLPSLALSGPAVSPVVPISAEALSRATGQPGGVVVVVEPQTEDVAGFALLGDLLRKGANKPQVLVVSKSFNAFAFFGALQGLKFDNIKARGQLFVRDLPLPPAVEDLPAAAQAVVEAPAKGASDGPRLAYVGREELQAELVGLLGEGGPIVVSGPAGVGRTWLVEHAVEAAGLTRHPDVDLGYGTGFDALAAMIGAIAEAGGSDLLTVALKQRDATPVHLVDQAVAALQAASGNEGQVLVVRELQYALGRRGDFFRKSRLELLLEALLTHRYPLRIVFTSSLQPAFYRESHNQALRRVEVGGLKGRFLHEIFDAYSAPEFSRDKFGPLSERIHGHPLAARMFAVAVRDRQEGLALLDDDKFLKADDLADDRALKKHLGKRVERLPDELRRALSLAGHFRAAMPGKLLADLGLTRKQRNQLLSLGLLDVVGTATGAKRYRVHPLLRQQLSFREISDFDVLRQISKLCGDQARASEGPEKLFWAHQANRAAELGRDTKGRVHLDVPDNDPVIEGIIGLLRRKEPRLDLADQQIGFVLKRNPNNADAHLLKIELYDRGRAKAEEIAQVLDEAVAQAPVPEVFHEAVNGHLHRRARGKAVSVLEQAVALLPDHSRLHTRLAALLLKQGRRPEAIAHLDTAMALDPQLPDAYGLLGMARRDEGVDALDSAEQLLREAVRLAPDDATQVSRLVDLLLERARVAEFDVRDRLRAEAHELIDRAIRTDDKSPELQLQLAGLIRDEGGDLERASWLLKQVRKVTDRQHDRRPRLQLEEARLALAQGELDVAEKAIRELADKDPSNDRVFASLAELLVKRELFIPAHAEYMRARERTAPNTLARLEYETEIARLQALIEAQAAGLLPTSSVDLGHAAPEPELHSASAHRIIRRRGKGDASEHHDDGDHEEPAAEAHDEASPADGPEVVPEA